MSSLSRLSSLDRVFSHGRSQLLNKRACLSVLYEDFRIEWCGLNAETSFGDLDTIGRKYRALYFLRRSLGTITEYQGCLTQLLSTKEFTEAEPFVAKVHSAEIRAANWYFQTNSKRIRELRNEFGVHLKLSSIEFATSSLTSKTVGEVTWCSPEKGDHRLSLELHYANEILAAAIGSRLQGGVDLVDELQKALNIIMTGYVHIQGSYCLASSEHAHFLWEAITVFRIRAKTTNGVTARSRRVIGPTEVISLPPLQNSGWRNRDSLPLRHALEMKLNELTGGVPAPFAPTSPKGASRPTSAMTANREIGS